MKINRFNPAAQKKENVFFIQSHGFHAGRPLREPIPNSWQIETQNPQGFEICFMLYNSRHLKNLIRGSVIPFIALHEYKKILKPLLENPKQDHPETQKKLHVLSLIDKAILEQQKILATYTEMKKIFAAELLKNFTDDFKNSHSQTKTTIFNKAG